jgi:hypothetical protein
MFSFRAIVLLAVLVTAAAVSGQTNRKPVSSAVDPDVKATAAFAEVALKRTDFEAELEALLVDYTDEFPKVKELKYALTRIEAESARLMAIKPSERGKATSALGKLMVRKVEAEIDLWKLQSDYADTHPEVRRAKKKVEIFEKAIKEILG